MRVYIFAVLARAWANTVRALGVRTVMDVVIKGGGALLTLAIVYYLVHVAHHKTYILDDAWRTLKIATTVFATMAFLLFLSNCLFIAPYQLWNEQRDRRSFLSDLHLSYESANVKIEGAEYKKGINEQLQRAHFITVKNGGLSRLYKCQLKLGILSDNSALPPRRFTMSEFFEINPGDNEDVKVLGVTFGEQPIAMLRPWFDFEGQLVQDDFPIGLESGENYTLNITAFAADTGPAYLVLRLLYNNGLWELKNVSKR